MTLVEALVFSGATLLMAAVISWWVLRPFERERRAQRAQKHAAE